MSDDDCPPCPTCGIAVEVVTAGLSDEELRRRGIDPSMRPGPSALMAEPCGHPLGMTVDVEGIRRLHAIPAALVGLSSWEPPTLADQLTAAGFSLPRSLL